MFSVSIVWITGMRKQREKVAGKWHKAGITALGIKKNVENNGGERK